MNGCKFPKTWLMAWLDDEMDEHARAARDHLKTCRACAAEVEAWRKAGVSLKKIIDDGVGEVEPLLALEKIHARIAAAEEMPFFDRLRRSFAELMLLNRRVLAGAMVAAALGALTAPFVVYSLGPSEVLQTDQVQAAVVVESLEVGGDATAVVFSGESGGTTIIWVESERDAKPTEESL